MTSRSKSSPPIVPLSFELPQPQSSSSHQCGPPSISTTRPSISNTSFRCVQWCPFTQHEDVFAVANSDLRVYSISENKQNTHKTSTHRPMSVHYNLISSCSFAAQSLTCMSWARIETRPKLIATGLKSGKVSIVDMSATSVSSSSHFVGDMGVFGTNGVAINNGEREEENERTLLDFVPKYSRRVLAMAFNPVHQSQLAIGLDKVRNAHSAVIWDINQLRSSDTAGHHHHHQRALAQFSNTEVISSICWMPDKPSVLCVGAGLKWLRLYDVRTPMEPFVTVGDHSGVIQGISVAPFAQHVISSFSIDGVMKLWDMRFMKNENAFIAKCQLDAGLKQVVWSPTQSSMFATCSSSNSKVELYSINTHALSSQWQDTVECSREQHNPSTQSKPLTSPKHLNVFSVSQSFIAQPASISFHSSHPNRILVQLVNGELVHRTLHDKVPLVVSPTHFEALYAVDETIFSRPFVNNDNDILVVMRNRIEQRYALDVNTNASIFESGICKNNDLHRIWTWLQHCIFFWEQKTADSMHPLSYAQASSRLTQPPLGGVLRCLNIQELHAERTSNSPINDENDVLDRAFVFNNEYRSAAITLLGWYSLDDTPGIKNHINRLRALEKYEEAAAFSLFHLDMNNAIDALTDGANNTSDNTKSTSLSLLALSLAGYRTTLRDSSAKKNIDAITRQTSWRVWATSCASIASTLSSGYARALLNFLCHRFWEVLDDHQLPLAHRVAFACRFLCDDDLVSYVSAEFLSSVKTGNINALILSGIGSPRSLEVLQAYLDCTSDIQTTALFSCFALSSSENLSRETTSTFDRWLNIYRNLLDRWKLWHHRAHLDIARNQLGRNRVTRQPQVFARCNFCCQPLSLSHLTAGVHSRRSAVGRGRLRAPMLASTTSTSSTTSLRARASGCPSCNKALPRCALCIMPLDCAIPTPTERLRRHRQRTGDTVDDDDVGIATSDVDRWFTWCQSCHHCAHSTHIAEWFDTHNECPVSGCSCPCASDMKQLEHVK